MNRTKRNILLVKIVFGFVAQLGKGMLCFSFANRTLNKKKTILVYYLVASNINKRNQTIFRRQTLFFFISYITYIVMSIMSCRFERLNIKIACDDAGFH